VNNYILFFCSCLFMCLIVFSVCLFPQIVIVFYHHFFLLFWASALGYYFTHVPVNYICLCVCFRFSGHKDLGDRLVECMYELTDRLAYYLCSRKPDHQIGQHYIVPEMSDTVDLTEFAKAARKKLQLVRNHHIWHSLNLTTHSVLSACLLIIVKWKESIGITGKSS
jgi:hypothetical protein